MEKSKGCFLVETTNVTSVLSVTGMPFASKMLEASFFVAFIRLMT